MKHLDLSFGIIPRSRNGLLITAFRVRNLCVNDY